jgi:hypothetical protein
MGTAMPSARGAGHKPIGGGKQSSLSIVAKSTLQEPLLSKTAPANQGGFAPDL